MKRWIPLLLICLGLPLLAGSAFARSIPLTEYNALRHVEISRDGEELLMRFDFKNPIRQKLEPHYFKRSVQLDFALTYVDPPKRHYPVNESPVTQVYVSQFDSRLMRVRFILADENGLDRRHFKFQKAGKSLEVRIKAPGSPYDEELDRLIERAVGASSRQQVIEKSEPEEKSIESQPAKKEPDVPSIRKKKESPRIKKVAFTGSDVQPLGEVKESEIPELKKSTPIKLKDQDKEPIVMVGNERSQEGDSLWGSAFKMLSTLAFVIGLMFLVFYIFKKVVVKQGMFGTADKPIRVISTGFLGPKKSIAMVEVAGRVLILGVANDQITLLSSLEDEDEVARIVEGGEKKHSKSSEKPEAVTSKSNAAPAVTARKEDLPDLYTRKQKATTTPTPARKKPGVFSKYVKQFSKADEGNNQAVNDLKRMIRQRSGRVKVGA